MLAQFASSPHAAFVTSATVATTARTLQSALLSRNLRYGTLTAHYSRIRQAFHTSSCSISAPRVIPVSAFGPAPSHFATPRRAISVQQRHCSYQRNMCRQHFGFGADVVESHIDVSKGREVLPKNVKPLRYGITLEPDLDTFEFDGQVDIE